MHSLFIICLCLKIYFYLELAEKKKKEMQKKAETAVKNAEEIFKTCMRNEVGSNSTISTPLSTVPSTSSSC